MSWNPAGAPWPQQYYAAPPGHVFMPPPQPWIRPGPGYWEQAFPQQIQPATSLRSRYTHLNPILASDTTQIKYNVRSKPRAEIDPYVYNANAQTPVTLTAASTLRLISRAFPWSIDIATKHNQPLTCEHVWDAIHACLQVKVEDSEWGFISLAKKPKEREVIERAMKKRITDGDGDKYLKRIDIIGDATMFKGLDKDEEFAKARKVPGTKDSNVEVWVIKLGP
ncbi:hypothetical protein DL96DRAFT_1753208 [Flagelloscypha sp. PMI_526]|nr:hypothetical protein DL96DRAFT_1753208 [Flagelloscypha sp. PMI_526]